MVKESGAGPGTDWPWTLASRPFGVALVVALVVVLVVRFADRFVVRRQKERTRP